MAACGLVAVNAFVGTQQSSGSEYLTSILSRSSVFQETTSPSVFNILSGVSIADIAKLSYAEKLSLNEQLTSIAQRWRHRDKSPLALAPSSDKHKLIVLMLAMLQYPLHIYMIFALRAGNEHLLNGDSENYWGFGQVVALVLLASSVIQGFRAILGRYSYLLWYS